MNDQLLAHQQIRNNLIQLLNETPLDELVHIPNGYNNNIFWNIAHAVATQQLLHYYLSNNTFRIDQYWIDTFKKGTLAKLDINEHEVEDLKFILSETSKILNKDYKNDHFQDYNPYTTSFGIDLKNIEQAIAFNNMHETLHYGYAMAQKRSILGENF